MPRKIHLKFYFPVVELDNKALFEIAFIQDEMVFTFNDLWTSVIATGGAILSAFAMIFVNTLPRRYFKWGRAAFDKDIGYHFEEDELETLVKTKETKRRESVSQSAKRTQDGAIDVESENIVE